LQDKTLGEGDLRLKQVEAAAVIYVEVSESQDR